MILFVAYLFRVSQVDFAIGIGLQYAGLFIAITGSGISLFAIITLNKNLSPFPSPKKSGKLIQAGIYKYIRHPIYTGILSFAIGFAVYSENTLRIIVFVLLFILFKFKAVYEEQLLQHKFSDYAAYKKASGMFLPVI